MILFKSIHRTDPHFKLLKSRIRRNDAIILTSKPISRRLLPNNPRQRPGFKPKGLWYGVGSSWIDFVADDHDGWMNEYVSKLQFHRHIKVLRSQADIRDFNKQFHDHLDEFSIIQWNEVSRWWGGIEITTPITKRLRDRYDWLDHWDVPSGCIWEPRLIQGFVPIYP